MVFICIVCLQILMANRLDKFPTYGQDGYEVNTDKYFNKGYGKMYLMR